MECNHIIGTGDQDYHMGLVRADAEEQDVDINTFVGFKFCPECGADVSAPAQAFQKMQDDLNEAFWERYNAQHGEDEYQRARFSRGPKWDEQVAKERKAAEESWLKSQQEQQRIHDLINPKPKPSHFFSIPKEP